MINLYCPNCGVESAYDLEFFENYDEYNEKHSEALRCKACGYELATGSSPKEDEETVTEDAIIDDENLNDEVTLEDGNDDTAILADEDENNLDALLDTIEKYENEAVA